MTMDEAILQQMMELGLPWLWEQRNLHLARARRLPAEERTALQDYFDHRILGKVRVAAVDRISNPPFYAELKAAGYPTMDISGAMGIAFIDCVVVRKSCQSNPVTWHSVLFHELVHIVQFDILGPEKHLEVYLRGWMDSGYQYPAIPMETQAQRLEARFNRHEPPFSVRDILEQELAGMV